MHESQSTGFRFFNDISNKRVPLTTIKSLELHYTVMGFSTFAGAELHLLPAAAALICSWSLSPGQ